MSFKYHHATVSVCYCVSIIIRLRAFLRVSDIDQVKITTCACKHIQVYVYLCDSKPVYILLLLVMYIIS